MERRNTLQSPIFNTQTTPMLKSKENQKNNLVGNSDIRKEVFDENPGVGWGHIPHTGQIYLAHIL